MFELFNKIVEHFTKIDTKINTKIDFFTKNKMMDSFEKKINDCNHQYENKKEALILNTDIDPKILNGKLGFLFQENKKEINLIKLHNNQCQDFINKVMEHYESGALANGNFKFDKEHDRDRILFYNTLHNKLCFEELEKKLPNNKIIIKESLDGNHGKGYKFYTTETGELIFQNFEIYQNYN